VWRARTAAQVATFGLWILASAAFAQAPLRVHYPAAESTTDARQDYPRAVLALALEHHDRPHRLVAADLPATQQRALRQLAAGDRVDVVLSTATDARDRTLHRIPVAIDRGMIGWRVLLVRRGDAPRLAQARELAALARWRTAQGHDWPDLQILRAAGLEVQAASNYESMFEMLARGRIDYLPRSVLEVTGELQRRPARDLAVAPGLMLRYPAGLFFFVRRGNRALAHALEDGLRRAIADGCLPRLFEATYAQELRALALPSRSILALPNPTWSGDPAATPW